MPLSRERRQRSLRQGKNRRLVPLPLRERNSTSGSFFWARAAGRSRRAPATLAESYAPAPHQPVRREPAAFAAFSCDIACFESPPVARAFNLGAAKAEHGQPAAA